MPSIVSITSKTLVKSGSKKFFDFFPRSIDRFVYTTMVSIIVGFIVDFFFIEEKKIQGIFKRGKK